MIFTIIYLAFFIYLNFTVYSTLKIGFKENKKQSLITLGCVFVMLLFHKFFYIKGMIDAKVFLILIFFSLGLIIMHYLDNLVKFRVDNRLAKANPKLLNSESYGIFNNISSFMSREILPIGITLFQILVVFDTGIQKALNL